MQCSRPVKGYVKYGGGFTTHIKDANMGQLLTLPCGQCIQCRINRQEEWAIRCVHESKSHPEETNHFVTLTYDETNIPDSHSLEKQQLLDFIRALRKRTPNKIRYYASGEYGDKGGRPHYHALIFNLPITDLTPLRRNKNGEWLYQSLWLEKSWQKGECPIGQITWQSAKYAAKYTQKIYKSRDQQEIADHYSRSDGQRQWQVQPEFQIQSRGLGLLHLQKFYKDHYPLDFCIINGKKKQLPSYYDYALKKIDEKLHYQVMQKRRQQAKENYSYPDQKDIEIEADRIARVLAFKLTREQQRKQQGIRT